MGMTISTDAVAALALADFGNIIDPPSKRMNWYNSRLAVLPDGSTRSVLDILAEVKFGPLDQWHRPYWKDKTWTNETMENVEVTDLTIESRARKSKYGVPSNTPEYWKKYAAANRDKQREYQRKRYNAQKALVLKAKRMEESGVIPQALQALVDKLQS